MKGSLAGSFLQSDLKKANVANKTQVLLSYNVIYNLLKIGPGLTGSNFRPFLLGGDSEIINRAAGMRILNIEHNFKS